jgi:hypothetical protein
MEADAVSELMLDAVAAMNHVHVARDGFEQMALDKQQMGEQIPPCVLQYALDKIEWLKSKCYPNYIIVYWIVSPIVSIPLLLMGFVKCKR